MKRSGYNRMCGGCGSKRGETSGRQDTVLAFTRKRKSILLLFEKSFNDQRFSVTLELKTKEIDDLFRALETARMGHIKF